MKPGRLAKNVLPLVLLIAVFFALRLALCLHGGRLWWPGETRFEHGRSLLEAFRQGDTQAWLSLLVQRNNPFWLLLSSQVHRVSGLAWSLTGRHGAESLVVTRNL